MFKVHISLGLRISSEQAGFKESSKIARSMLSVALPSTVEPISTEFLFVAQIMIIAQFGDIAVVSHSYAFNISLLVVVVAASLALATQIIVSHAIGSRRLDNALSLVHSYFRLVAFVGFVVGLVLWFFSEHILALLTSDPTIIETASRLLLISLVVQFGVAANLVFGMALRTTTDSRYSAIMGFLVMWTIGLPSMLVGGFAFRLVLQEYGLGKRLMKQCVVFF